MTKVVNELWVHFPPLCTLQRYVRYAGYVRNLNIAIIHHYKRLTFQTDCRIILDTICNSFIHQKEIEWASYEKQAMKIISKHIQSRNFREHWSKKKWMQGDYEKKISNHQKVRFWNRLSLRVWNREWKARQISTILIEGYCERQQLWP